MSESGRNSPPHGVTLAAAFKVWLRVALLSFGGPAGQIAVMHRILVDEQKWIGERRFLHALNYCMLLPGPEAQQLATYIGWLMHRTLGGLIAGGLFILPGAVSILALSFVYALYGDLGPIDALFFGLKAAVLAIVVQAVFRVGRRALRGAAPIVLAAAAFLAIFAFDVPFPLIVLTAGGVGFLATRMGLDWFQGGGHGGGDEVSEHGLLGEAVPDHARPGRGRFLRTLLVWGSLWLVPVAALLLLLGPEDVFSRVAVFFSKMAVVTFGGAYAVLAYVAQQAVENYGWLEPGEMLDGLGMAETTPGPLIMVVQFVGFMAGFRGASGMDPLVGATLAALLTTWVTFAPCFLWIFLGAPYVEALRGNRALNGALTAITASVVGVILNLAVWFALHTWFEVVREERFGPLVVDMPDPASVQAWAVALSVAAGLGILALRFSMLVVLAASCLAGLVLFWLGLI